MFSCAAEGGPGNMFTWVRLYDGAIIGNETQLEINVTSAEDGSVYECNVQNIAGGDSTQVTLNGKY